MHDKASEMVKNNVLMHCSGDDGLTLHDAMKVVKDYVESKGVKKMSEFPVKEVFGHAIEISRLVALEYQRQYEARHSS